MTRQRSQPEAVPASGGLPCFPSSGPLLHVTPVAMISTAATMLSSGPLAGTLTMIIAASLLGCGPSGSAVRTGLMRPRTNPEAVTVYLERPANKYEVVGLVTSRSVNGFTQQSDTQKAIDELKRQAAKLGANGVLLTSSNTGSTEQVVAGVIGTVPVVTVSGYSSSAQLQGTAIFVLPSEASQ